MLQLNFPKPDTSKITIERVFEAMEFEETMDFINRVRKPSNSTIRLARDIAEQTAPLKFDTCDIVRSLLKTNIDDERIRKVRPYTEILFKRVIVNVRCQDDSYIIETKKVKRR